PDADVSLCDDIPPLPTTWNTLSAEPAEDFFFDDAGNMVSISNTTLYLKPYYGPPGAVAHGTVDNARGIRPLADGTLAVAEMNGDRIYRVAMDGGTEVLATPDAPNQVVMGNDGMLYVTGMWPRKVYRIDPTTGDTETIADIPSCGGGDPMSDSVDGLVFSPDWKTLYVNRGDGALFAMSVSEEGELGPPTQVADLDLGEKLWPDGMAVDICGNIYVSDHWGELKRVSPDGEVELGPRLIDNAEFGAVTPSTQFGSGIGGWDRSKLYVIVASQSTGALFELDIGIPGKDLPHLP
ncbi:MAG: SMP-30/gluconolactonase/LRE family protein, partial [Deltaproteobacteria bacterium]|nr:SMP-30/gluconolactonase/LRE family protein [Deltaproteobacteria bacterium]